MTITTQKKEEQEKDFSVLVQTDYTDIWEPAVEKITLHLGDTFITLNKNECKELMRVIKGKDCSTLSVIQEGQYNPHTMVHYSENSDNKPAQLQLTMTREDFVKNENKR